MDLHLGAVEEKFADIIWENEPLHSRDLVKLCDEKLDWRKSTTYTVLKKLCDRGIFQNNGGMVSSVLSKEKFNNLQTAQFVDKTFNGSLPAFIAAFTSEKKLSKKDITEIQKMIERI
ncbi:MAG: BlaI/MecI/CopY family transcriptional regulator [Lachnospiraceae bacterium]|nr:BlaI/MecI/CopY family transcriptional regulator [Lachnospiraceae bacterium]